MSDGSTQRRVEVAAIVPAAGSGQRLGAGMPKALVRLAGETLLTRAVRSLVADPRIGLVVACAPAGLEEEVRQAAALGAGPVPTVVVVGGATRADSVARGLAVVPDAVPVVLVHDAARCLVPRAVVTSVVDAVLGGALAVVPGLPVVDTIRQVDAVGASRMVDRASLRAVQTPQAFPAPILRQAHAAGDRGATDDAGMVEALGLPVQIVPGDPRAFKVTTALDLALALAVLEGPSGSAGSETPGAGDGR